MHIIVTYFVMVKFSLTDFLKVSNFITTFNIIVVVIHLHVSSVSHHLGVTVAFVGRKKDIHEGSTIIGQTIERSDFRIKNKIFLHKHTIKNILNQFNFKKPIHKILQAIH